MKQYITYITAGMLLASCSSSEDVLGVGAVDDDDMLTIGEVTTAKSSTTVISRAVVNDTVLTTSGNVGLFVMGSDTTSYVNKQYTYTANKGWSGVTDDDKIRLSQTATLTPLYGYYPYHSTWMDKLAIPLTASVGGDDICYGTYSDALTCSASPIKLQMYHALTRFDITVNKAASYTGSGNITRIALIGDNIGLTGYLDLTKTSGSSTADAITSSSQSMEYTGLAYTTGTTYQCLLVPVGTTASDVQFACTIDGVDYSVDLGTLEVLSGNKFSVTLSLGDKLLVQSVTVGAWTEGNSEASLTANFKLTINGTTDGMTFKYGKNTTANTITITAVPTARETTVQTPTCTPETAVKSKTSNGDGSYTVVIDLSKVSQDVVLTYAGVSHYSNTNGHNDYVEITYNGKTLKWAKYNLGASATSDTQATTYGYFINWGEVESYIDVSGVTLAAGTDVTAYFKKYAIGKCYHTVKTAYGWASYCGTGGFTEWTDKPYDDNLILKPEYDAARVNWGGSWRLPTFDEWLDLARACDKTPTGTNSTITLSGSLSGTTTVNAKGVYWVADNTTVDGVTYKMCGFLFVTSATDTSKRVFLCRTPWFASNSCSLGVNNTIYPSATASASNGNGIYYVDLQSTANLLIGNPANARYMAFQMRAVSY